MSDNIAFLLIVFILLCVGTFLHWREWRKERLSDREWSDFINKRPNPGADE